MRAFTSVFLLTCGLALGSACGFGVGSAYVGQWRAHEEVAFEVCIEDEQARCKATKQVKRQVPERSFWGLTLDIPSMGASFNNIDGVSSRAFRVEPSIGFLKGRGRWALGGRIGVLVNASDRSLVSVPFMALGHLNLSQRFSVYGGAGISPYSSLGSAQEDGPSSVTHTAGRALAGLQIVNNRARKETFILWNIEVDSLFADFDGVAYRSLGITGKIGLYF